VGIKDEVAVARHAAYDKLVDELQQERRYNAARAAAMAGCGQGEIANKFQEEERPGQRRQALLLLRADFVACRQLLELQEDMARPIVLEAIQHWQQDPDFAGLRSDALAKLPAEERQEWQKLWDNVEALRKRAAE